MIDYAVDGADLHDPLARWDVLASSMVAPGVTVNAVDLTIPGVAGSLPWPGAPQTAPQMTIDLLVRGASQDEMQANYGALAALLYAGTTLTRTVGTTVTSVGMELQTIATPVFSQSLNVYTTTAVLKLPTVYWRADSQDWTVSNPTSGTSYEVITLAGTTAPVVDALLLVTGPAPSPKITCGSSWCQLNLTVASGNKALVDCNAWTVRYGTGVTFAGGGTLQSGRLLTSGGPYVLPLRPGMRDTDPADTRVQVSMTSTGMSSATKLQIRAKPAYLV